jgi:hypothetical protein
VYSNFTELLDAKKKDADCHAVMQFGRWCWSSDGSDRTEALLSTQITKLGDS